MLDILGLTQRWYAAYGALPGKRVRIVTADHPEIPEVFWLLAQENEYLVLAQEPLRRDDPRRRLTVLNVAGVVDCEVLQGPDPDAPRLPVDQPGAALSMEEIASEVVFCPGRVSVHATTPSGSRSWIEITGAEPNFGGYFRGPNHLLAFALNHLHFDMLDMGLVRDEPLPLNARPWEIPTRSMTAPLPLDASPVATITVMVQETRSDQLGAGTFTPVHDPDVAGPKLQSRKRLLAWGYETLCKEAVNRRLLPTGFEPRIRRKELD